MFKRVSCVLLCASVLSAGFYTVPQVSVYAAEEASEDQEKSGLVKEDGHYCYYEDGELVTDSWITVEDDTYYFDKEGQASVFSCKIKGKYYVFDNEGRLQQPSSKKIVKIEGEDGKTKKYYVNEKGAAVSGWSKDSQYYFDETGEMLIGIHIIKGKFYCFNSGGKYNKAKTQKIRKAAGYEKPFAELLKYIGKPIKSEYDTSCYGNGKDGFLTYDGYTVYTFKPADGSAEIFMGAE